MAKTYMPPAVCIVAALLLIAGVPQDAIGVPFLLALGVSLIGYINVVRDRLRHYDTTYHPGRRRDDDA